MSDVVTITCYGRTETRERKAAIDFYSQGMDECDTGSSEWTRYATIVRQLRLGLREVFDS